MEQHLAVHLHPLHVVERMEDKRKRHNAQHGPKLRDIIELRDKRSRKKQRGVQDRCESHADVEHRVVVGLRGILLLHEGLAEPAVHQHVGDRDEHRQKRNRAVVVGSQEPG